MAEDTTEYKNFEQKLTLAIEKGKEKYTGQLVFNFEIA